jgi:hypothetical protein
MTRSKTSNEIVKNSNQKLIIKLWKDGKSTVLMEGTYQELKDKIDNDDRLHYTVCVYIMNKGKLEHLKLAGSCLGSWFDDIAKKPTNAWVMHVDTKDGKQGSVDYRFPIFAYGKELTEMEFDAAYEIDSKILQPYLEAYLGAGGKIDDVNQDAKAEEIPLEKWRQVKAPSGNVLGSFVFQELHDLSDSLDENSPLQDYIQKGIQEYCAIQKEWKTKTGSSGKSLDQYTIEECQVLMDQIVNGSKWTNPLKQYLEIAIHDKKIAQQNKSDFIDAEVIDEEDDSIPF